MLQQAGWDEVWEEKFADLAGKDLKPSRVLAQHRQSYSLWTGPGEIDAEIAGALLYRAEAGGLPVVGDWVAVRQYAPTDVRSEERRVGKECRCRWVRYDEKENR